MKLHFQTVAIIFIAINANATISPEGTIVKKSLEDGKSCSAIWSNESSKAGDSTNVFDVRELNSMTQYQVYHSAEHPRIWTWDYRLENIKCN